jgi:uncharacterized membrane protein
MKGLGTDVPQFGTVGNDAAFDGTVVGLSLYPHAIEWTPDNVAHILPALPTAPYPYTGANAITPDGHWIVGSSYSAAFHQIAVRWDENRQVTELPTGPDLTSAATDVSVDGSVIVGNVDDSQSVKAVRWTDGNGPEMLGDLPGGRDWSYATAISALGDVVVGSSSTESAPDYNEPFYWTSSTGMVSLGLLPGHVGGGAGGVTQDGTTVVGADAYLLPDGGTGSTPFIWFKGSGLQPLHDYLATSWGLGDKLVGWQLLSANQISSDGSVIVGSGIDPNGLPEAWMAVVPEPATAILAGLGVLMLVCPSGLRRLR